MTFLLYSPLTSLNQKTYWPNAHSKNMLGSMHGLGTSRAVDRVTVCWKIRFGTPYSPGHAIFNFCQWPPPLIRGRPAVKPLGAWQVSPPSTIPDNLCILFSLLYLENSTLSFKKAYLSVKRDGSHYSKV